MKTVYSDAHNGLTVEIYKNEPDGNYHYAIWDGPTKFPNIPLAHNIPMTNDLPIGLGSQNFSQAREQALLVLKEEILADYDSMATNELVHTIGRMVAGEDCV